MVVDSHPDKLPCFVCYSHLRSPFYMMSDYILISPLPLLFSLSLSPFPLLSLPPSLPSSLSPFLPLSLLFSPTS